MVNFMCNLGNCVPMFGTTHPINQRPEQNKTWLFVEHEGILSRFPPSSSAASSSSQLLSRGLSSLPDRPACQPALSGSFSEEPWLILWCPHFSPVFDNERKKREYHNDHSFQMSMFNWDTSPEFLVNGSDFPGGFSLKISAHVLSVTCYRLGHTFSFGPAFFF